MHRHRPRFRGAVFDLNPVKHAVPVGHEIKRFVFRLRNEHRVAALCEISLCAKHANVTLVLGVM